jgi:glycosyltransferase involved in cell wall biosynthesis
MRWMRDTLDWPFACILQRGGSLEPEFRALCQTVTLDRGDWIEGSARGNLLSRLGLARLRPYFDEACRDAVRLIQRADLVYLNTLDTHQIFRLATGRGKPILCHVHELETTIRTWIGTRRADEVLAGSERVIACAHAVAENLRGRRGVPPGRIDVVHESILPNAPDSEAGEEVRRGLREELRLGPKARLVGAVGQMGWRKGTDLFAQLAACVRRQAPGSDVYFVWLGDSLESNDHELFMHDVARLGVADRVIHLPARSEPASFYRALDVFVLTSREDPYPLVCLEAGACGVPVVCFADAGGIPEFVQPDAGLIVPYLDLDAMAGAVLRLLADEPLRAQLGACARRKVLAEHDVKVAAPQILESIRRTMEALR